MISGIEIGVIGGSGLYQMHGLRNAQERVVETPFGPPSDTIVCGQVGGADVAFLARHGRGHRLIPSEVPYRANIYAMRALGVRYLISISAVGSLREEIGPLDMVLPDQFIDLTRRRENSYFGDGAVAHVSMAQPVCPELSRVLASAHAAAGLEGSVRLHRGGTYVCIEGPAFSTRAESHWFRSFGASVVGMTNMPEAKLAREAQIAYATLALVTDFDAWHPREAPVTAEMAIANLTQNAERAQRLLIEAIVALTEQRPSSIAHHALDSALVTPPQAMGPAVRARLDVLLSSRPVDER